MSRIRSRAATFGAGTPDLAVVPFAGGNSGAALAVPGIAVNDVVVAIIDLTDGTKLTPTEVANGSVKLGEATTGDKLLAIFWSLGLGGSAS